MTLKPEPGGGPSEHESEAHFRVAAFFPCRGISCAAADEQRASGANFDDSRAAFAGYFLTRSLARKDLCERGSREESRIATFGGSRFRSAARRFGEIGAAQHGKRQHAAATSPGIRRDAVAAAKRGSRGCSDHSRSGRIRCGK